MARGKSKGFRYIGKEVQTSEFRIDKDLYLNRSKGTTNAKMNGCLVDQRGKLLTSPAAFTSATALVDDNTAVPKSGFTTGKIFDITTSAVRTKALPSTADLLDALTLTDFYQFVDIPFINLGGTHRLILSAGDGDTTFKGNTNILPETSGLFRFVAMNTPVDEIIIYRIA